METKKTFKVFQFHTQLKWTGERRGEMTAAGKSPFEIAPPPEFKGPEGVWTPENLFVAAIESCTMTTFLAYAERRKLPIIGYESAATGTLENVDGKFQFTKVELRPRITVNSHSDVPLAREIIESAERNCLISNSIKSEVQLQPEIVALQTPALEAQES